MLGKTTLELNNLDMSVTCQCRGKISTEEINETRVEKMCNVHNKDRGIRRA